MKRTLPFSSVLQEHLRRGWDLKYNLQPLILVCFLTIILADLVPFMKSLLMDCIKNLGILMTSEDSADKIQI